MKIISTDRVESPEALGLLGEDVSHLALDGVQDYCERIRRSRSMTVQKHGMNPVR
jgi:hypothetical protein